MFEFLVSQFENPYSGQPRPLSDAKETEPPKKRKRTMENGEKLENGHQNGAAKRKFSRRDEELIRLIGQHLVSLGLDQSAQALVKESGTMFENRLAQGFRQAIQGKLLKLPSSLLRKFTV